MVLLRGVMGFILLSAPHVQKRNGGDGGQFRPTMNFRRGQAARLETHPRRHAIASGVKTETHQALRFDGEERT
jgi:hypothetical protein